MIFPINIFIHRILGDFPLPRRITRGYSSCNVQLHHWFIRPTSSVIPLRRPWAFGTWNWTCGGPVGMGGTAWSVVPSCARTCTVPWAVFIASTGETHMETRKLSTLFQLSMVTGRETMTTFPGHKLDNIKSSRWVSHYCHTSIYSRLPNIAMLDHRRVLQIGEICMGCYHPLMM